MADVACFLHRADRSCSTEDESGTGWVAMLTVALLGELLADRGQEALRLARTLDLRPTAQLQSLAALRRRYPAPLAAAAYEMATLQSHARTKWSRGDEMYWTREALEQASGEIIARYRAERFGDSAQVADLCCSVGSDTIALATAGRDVTGVDHDPLRLALGAANAAVWGVAARVQLRAADVTTLSALPAPLVFFDPGRRSGTHRIHDPDAYSPPLRTVDHWLKDAQGIAIKVAPGIPYDQLPWPCEVEVVSIGGAVKETILWLGALRQGDRQATLLPAGLTLRASAGPAVPLAQPLRFVYEPDGAIIRAHLVEELARMIGAAKLDPEIAYLTADHRTATPFARSWEVLETMAFNLKQLRARLRELDVGHVVVKKRGSPIDPQELEKQLRLTGEHSLTLILTRVAGKPTVLLCEPTIGG